MGEDDHTLLELELLKLTEDAGWHHAMYLECLNRIQVLQERHEGIDQLELLN